jgi:murein DD-endopeptidase MepM/ murein hydrolase activator NlpD
LKSIGWVILVLLLAGCAPLAARAPAAGPPLAPTAAPPTPPPTFAPTATAATLEPSATPARPPEGPCAPLQDVSIAQLLELAKEPFVRPRPGFDDGHHGVDFAYYTLGERQQMLGHPVQSVFAGQVAAALPNRPPYGYTLIVETPLEDVPAALRAGLDLAPQPTPRPGDIRLSCPALPELAATGKQSLYLLYAHLNALPLVDQGETVACGETVGEVGTTGNSINPHLHLEARVGPAGARFDSMAHYLSRATQEEMANYCLWRVSGVFQLLDPITLFK